MRVIPAILFSAALSCGPAFAALQPAAPTETAHPAHTPSQSLQAAASFHSDASNQQPFQQSQPAPKTCWQMAAEYHSVDPWLLYSIAWVESRFEPTAVGRNRNGSQDSGIMQINSIWLPTLAKYGIQRSQLKDPCTSIFIGAWILRKNIDRFGYTWRAIGAYNSATPHIGYQYAKKVYAAHRQFTGTQTRYLGRSVGP